MFVILINELPSVATPGTSIRLFADDTRASRAIRALLDANLLLADLDKLYDWNVKSNLKENEDKFETLQYDENLYLKSQYDYMTPNCNGPIEKKNTVKDLGVLISDTAKFSEQNTKVIRKVWNTLN
jgi:hypothetical protein